MSKELEKLQNGDITNEELIVLLLTQQAANIKTIKAIVIITLILMIFSFFFGFWLAELVS